MQEENNTTTTRPPPVVVAIAIEQEAHNILHTSPQSPASSTSSPRCPEACPCCTYVTPIDHGAKGEGTEGVYTGGDKPSTVVSVERCLDSRWCSPCGSCRRFEQLVGDRATLLAMGVMAASAVVYSFQYLDVKKAGKHHGGWTIAFFRGLVGGVAALISALLTKNRKGPLWGAHKENIKWLVLRGLFGGTTIITSFLAVLEIDLSDATVILATSTLWTAAMAVVFEKGAWTRGDSLAAMSCIVGIILVTKPAPLFYHPHEDDEKNVTLGVMCALVSAMSQGAVNMCIRRIRDEDTSVLTLYAMVFCTFMALPGMIYEQLDGVGNSLDQTPPIQMVHLYSTGLLSYGAQMLKTLALQISTGIGVITLRYLDTVLAFVWDSVIFHSETSITSACGAILIISGCLMSLFAKTISQILPVCHAHCLLRPCRKSHRDSPHHDPTCRAVHHNTPPA